MNIIEKRIFNNSISNLYSKTYYWGGPTLFTTKIIYMYLMRAYVEQRIKDITRKI